MIYLYHIVRIIDLVRTFREFHLRSEFQNVSDTGAYSKLVWVNPQVDRNANRRYNKQRTIRKERFGKTRHSLGVVVRIIDIVRTFREFHSKGECQNVSDTGASSRLVIYWPRKEPLSDKF